jgi:quercetin dioxygenase-like cupin family protein
MSQIFPKPITDLPEADIPLNSVKGYLSQSEVHQILFMEFEENAEVPEHSHACQFGIILEGKIELTINNNKRIYTKGDYYYIPGGARHSAKIYSGYADVTFFNEPNRYTAKSKNVL